MIVICCLFVCLPKACVRPSLFLDANLINGVAAPRVNINHEIDESMMFDKQSVEEKHIIGR